MDNNFAPYLCGGIFFSFLIELHNETVKGYNNSLGNNVMNQTMIMQELIYAINPDYSYAPNATSTLSKETSKYHTCQGNGGKVLPFERDNTRTSFDNSVKKHYDEVLERMTKFTTKCFPECKETPMCNLVERTLKIIRDDASIENDTPFFINQNGSSISKENLLKENNFNFQSFLVGIWHYIITKPTENKNGRPTFEKLYPEKEEESRKLDTSCFERYEHDIHVTAIEASEKSTTKEYNKCENITASNESGTEEAPAIKIYYRGSLLEEIEEKEILSFSPAIIDLDINPDISIEDNPVSSIYKITTEFQFETHFLSFTEEIIRLSCNIGSSIISGTTSLERWLSRSKFNNMRFRKKGSCTAWFKLKKFNENEYDADFYMIGEILQ